MTDYIIPGEKLHRLYEALESIDKQLSEFDCCHSYKPWTFEEFKKNYAVAKK